MRKKLLSTLAGCAVVLSLSVYAVTALLSPAAGAGSNATIKGKVVYKGTPPKPQMIKPSEKKCKAHLKGKPIPEDRGIVVNGGALKWVFVYVKDGVKGKPPVPKDPVVIDQQGCRYHPHVFGIMTGQTLEVRNSDPLLHNIHALPTKNPPFNQGQPKQGMKFTKVWNIPEVMVKFKCEVHPWMAAYCGVLPHPYYGVSGDDGSFEIKNLPPGSYTIEAWQEKLGTQTQKVTVKAGETKQITFTFEKK